MTIYNSSLIVYRLRVLEIWMSYLSYPCIVYIYVSIIRADSFEVILLKNTE